MHQSDMQRPETKVTSERVEGLRKSLLHGKAYEDGAWVKEFEPHPWSELSTGPIMWIIQ